MQPFLSRQYQGRGRQEPVATPRDGRRNPAADELVDSIPLIAGHLRLDGPVLHKNGLVVHYAAIGISWNDVTIPLSLAEARILSFVVLHGAASWADMNHALGGRRRTNETLRVLTYRIRAKMRNAGAPNPFQTVAGWGVRLRAMSDPLSTGAA